MEDRTCSAPNCEGKHYCKGYCMSHYNRMKARGTFEPYEPPTLAERFQKNVAKSEDCWLWTGYIRKDGYGTISFKCRRYAAHRVAYEIANGEIPEGLRVDHICHNPPCVNPDHLRLVTIKQNAENYDGLVSTNTSGVRGVYWHAGGKKWAVQVRHNDRRYSGGLHVSLIDAESAAIELRNRLHTHNDKDRVA